jgi:hypothetical protein
MIFQNRLKNPRVMMSIGMMCLAIAIVGPWFCHPTSKFWLDTMEGVRGMLIGVSLVLNLGSFRLAKRQRRCNAN